MLVACSKSNGPWVDRLEVEAFEGGEVISLSKEQLKQIFVAKLEAAKFKVPKAGQAVPSEVQPWRLKLAAGLTEPDLERNGASVAVLLEVQHTGQSEPFSLDFREGVKAPGNDVESMQGAIRESLEEAVGRAVRQTGALIELQSTSDEKLIRKLDDKDRAVRDASVQLLVRNKNKAVLPSLLAQLKDEDLEVLRPVIGLLVELKAPESVNPLIEAGNHRGPLFQREVVFALGSIGGGDAEAYLDLVSTGHDDPLVRASATQALLELRQKKSSFQKEGSQ